MVQRIKELLDQSGKHRSVEFAGKSRRISLDENFGKHKIEFINQILGNEENRKQILKKISGR